MSIVAKFKCTYVKQIERMPDPALSERQDNVCYSEIVHLDAFTGVDEDNVEWARFTPSGTIEMTIDNPGAQGQIRPGQMVSVVLTVD